MAAIAITAMVAMEPMSENTITMVLTMSMARAMVMLMVNDNDNNNIYGGNN